ncbi:hypothetical protein CHUAL_010997 [Chamberlinius hualienensis]
MEEVELKLKPNGDEENGNIRIKEKGKIADRSKKGLTLWTAAIFILGEMAGSGVLALPEAVVNAGWAGLIMIATFCFTSGYSGTRLSLCWIMLEERFERYRKEIQNPYPSIGFEAYGRWMRHLVAACVNITLFGVGTVLLILAATMTQGVISDYWYQQTSCIFILIIAVVLTPFMWLGTPKDFWPIAVGAAVSTAVACVLIVIRSAIDYNRSASVFEQPDNSTVVVPHEVVYPTPTFSSFCLAFGTILFSYGGASTFPTIQNDMRDRTLFSKAVAIAFSGIAMLYLPVAGVCYVLFGNKIKSNILATLTHGPDVILVQVLMAAHLFFAYVIIINPFCQEFERIFKIPNRFGWKRCLVRSCIMVCIVFVAETVPNFGSILSLVGASTITLLTFVFPPLFYMKLVDKKSTEWRNRRVKLGERIFLWCLIILGMSGGAVSTYHAILKIAAPDAFSLPCYVSSFMAAGSNSTTSR